MSIIGALVIPIMICGIVLYGLFMRVNVFDSFIEGARDGMKTAVDILPPLLALVVAVSMLRTSGALGILVNILRPVSDFFGIPPEVSPLALLCPVSGSGSFSMYQSLLTEYGVDNPIERAASIMMCSTETTFYAIAIYYGAVNIKKIRYTVPAALTADITSFIMSSLLDRIMYT